MTGYSPGCVPSPPDPDDRHVLAAALHADADVLVTNDGRGRDAFPEDCVQGRLEVWTADEFLNWVADNSMALVQQVLERQLAYYRRVIVAEERDEAGMIAYLGKSGAPRFAQRLEEGLSRHTA